MTPLQDDAQTRGGPTARAAWTLLGAVALSFGALGIVLPLLPTTPLVILAAFAFAKGSPRLARMLHDHPGFGPAIMAWREEGAIARPHKYLALAMMGAALAASVALAVGTFILIVQMLIMAGAAAFILTRPDRTA